MKKKNLLFPLVVVLFAVVFTGCDKEGPAGPAGATGAAGPAGPAGPGGPAGPTGTANVMYSKWTTGSTWSIDPGTGLNTYDIAAAALTQSILSNGSIQVYWAVLGDSVNNVRQLPFTESVDAEVFYHNTQLSVGSIRIETDNLLMSTDNRYRYILIPGGTLTGKMENIDFSNYKETIRRLGIPE